MIKTAKILNLVMSVPTIRGFTQYIQDPNSLREDIVATRKDDLSVRNAYHKYNVPTHSIKSGINALKEFEEVRGARQ